MRRGDTRAKHARAHAFAPVYVLGRPGDRSEKHAPPAATPRIKKVVGFSRCFSEEVEALTGVSLDEHLQLVVGLM